jgi:hypothetical protein
VFRVRPKNRARRMKEIKHRQMNWNEGGLWGDMSFPPWVNFFDCTRDWIKGDWEIHMLPGSTHLNGGGSFVA